MEPSMDLGGGGARLPYAKLDIWCGLWHNTLMQDNPVLCKLERNMVKKALHFAIDSAIADSLATIVNQRKRIALFKKQANKLNRVLNDLSLILSGTTVSHNLYAYAYAYNHDDDTSFTIALTLRGIEGFKCPALSAVLEYCNEKCEPNRTSTSDWAESLNREFRFKLTPKYGDNCTITVNAYVKSDSPTCRKVVVGTTIEEVKRYEIQCD